MGTVLPADLEAVVIHERTVRRPSPMKLALYLPNFRDKVTVKELRAFLRDGKIGEYAQ